MKISGGLYKKWMLFIMARPIEIEEIISGEKKLRGSLGSGTLAEMHPDLAAQWHPTKNGWVTPEDIGTRSCVNAWWHCNKHDGDYKMIVNNRVKGSGNCPICSGTRIDPNINSLGALYPELAQEWDPNNTCTSLEVSAKSGKVVKWICPECGNHWETGIRTRTLDGAGCKKCGHKLPPLTNSQLLEKPTDKPKRKKISAEERLLTNYAPEIANEWDIEKNAENDLFVENATYGQGTKVWWICPQGHSYQMSISHRTSRGSGCPYCARRQILVGFNDLATTHPDIANELDVERSHFTAQEVSAGNASKDAYWICPVHGISYYMKAHLRTDPNAPIGCPECGHEERMRKAYLPKNGSCADMLPFNLLAEWSDRNDLSPDEVSPHSRRKIWWKCTYGHEWQDSPINRNRKFRNNSCPICHKDRSTSLAEQAIFHYIKAAFPTLTVENRYHPKINGNHRLECDIAIIERKIAIEHDGSYWHKNREQQEENKDKVLEKAGWQIFRIKEISSLDGETYEDTDTVLHYLMYPTSYNVAPIELTSVITKLLGLLGSDYNDVDVERDLYKIKASYAADKHEKLLLALKPDIAAEWSPKNYPLTPAQVTTGCNMKVWWVCKEGHEWQAIINNRTKKKHPTGCPECARLRKQKRKNREN